MDTGNTTGAHRQDGGLRERIAVSQPVDVAAVDEALANAGYDPEETAKNGESSTMTFGRTPEGTSKYIALHWVVGHRLEAETPNSQTFLLP